MADLKIKRAPAVQSNDRAWLQVYDDINDIVNAVNNKSGTESRTKGTLGSDGDIRLYKDSDASKYFIEGKFKDGWAKRELLFTDTDETYQNEIINTSETENYVRKDGTIAFTAAVGGVDPTASSQLATKNYVDSQLTLSDLDIQGDGGGALSIDLDGETLVIAGGNALSTVGNQNTITVNADEYDPIGGTHKGVVLTSDTYDGGSPGNFITHFLRKDGVFADPSTALRAFKIVSWVPQSGTPFLTTADATADTLSITAGSNIEFTDGSSNDTDAVTLSVPTGTASALGVVRVAGGNALTASYSSGVVTLHHDDTSSASSVDNSGTTFIQDLTFDGYGHVTARTSAAIPEYDPVGGVHTGVVNTSDTYSGGNPSANNFTTYFLRKDGGWANPLGSVDTFKTVSWVPSGGGTPFTTVADDVADTLTITAGTGIQVALTAGDHVTITNTVSDTNTWRGIDDTPVDGQTAESISSNWAHDHTASASAHHSRYTDSEAQGAMGVKGDSNPYHHDKYTHPTDAGNKHIPSGGGSGEYLKYSSSGTAVWDGLSGSDVDSGIVSASYGGTGVTSVNDFKTTLGLGNAAYTDLGTGSGDAAYGNHNHSGTYATVSGTTSNGVMTHSGSGVALNTESNLLYDGGVLTVNKLGTSDGVIRIEADENNDNENYNPYLIFVQDGNYEESAVYMTSNQLIIANAATSGGGMSFRTTNNNTSYTVSTERMLIQDDGDIVPGSNEAYDFGSSSKKWDNIFGKNIKATTFYGGGTYAGITTTRSFTVTNGDVHSVTIKGGIITGWDVLE